MGTYQFANNASTTLGSAISSTATTISVAAGTGAEFPQPANGTFFTATLWKSGSATGTPNEIVKVTARVGDTMTVVRGQEGTTAQSWSVGDTFANYPTAGFYNQLNNGADIQLQAGNYAADTGTANAGAVILNPVITAYANIVGMPIRIKKMNAANTGSYTLNVNNLGAQAVNLGHVALSGGELPPNTIFEVVWNGSSFDVISAPGRINTPLLANDSVNNAILAQMAASAIKGNLTGSPGQPYDVPLSDLLAALGLPLATGGVAGSNGWVALNVAGMGSPLYINYGLTTNHVPGNLWNGTFAHAFPNVCITVIAAYYGNIAGGNHNQDDMCAVQSFSKTGFVYHMSGDADDHTVGIFYVAFGY